LNKLKSEGRSHFSGKVNHITSSGFSVKLDDNGLEGLVDLRPEEEKFSFDKWTMSLTSTTRRFELLQTVEVEFIDAPADGDYLALFALVEGCGLKPPKETKLDEDSAALSAETEARTDANAQTETDSALPDA
jgi:ribonuclease R